MPELWARAPDATNRKLRELYARDGGGANRKLKELWARDTAAVNRKIFNGVQCKSISDNGIAADGSLHMYDSYEVYVTWFALQFDDAIYLDSGDGITGTGITFKEYDNQAESGLQVSVYDALNFTNQIAWASFQSTTNGTQDFQIYKPKHSYDKLCFQIYKYDPGTFSVPSGGLWIAGRQITSVELT